MDTGYYSTDGHIHTHWALSWLSHSFSWVTSLWTQHPKTVSVYGQCWKSLQIHSSFECHQGYTFLNTTCSLRIFNPRDTRACLVSLKIIKARVSFTITSSRLLQQAYRLEYKRKQSVPFLTQKSQDSKIYSDFPKSCVPSTPLLELLIFSQAHVFVIYQWWRPMENLLKEIYRKVPSAHLVSLLLIKMRSEGAHMCRKPQVLNKIIT